MDKDERRAHVRKVGLFWGELRVDAAPPSSGPDGDSGDRVAQPPPGTDDDEAELARIRAKAARWRLADRRREAAVLADVERGLREGWLEEVSDEEWEALMRQRDRNHRDG